MSLDPLDLTDFSNAQGQSGVQPNRGKKWGQVRGIFSATGGLATGTYNLVGLKGENLVIPSGSVITRACWKVLTSFESGTDAATIALQAEAANDLKTATLLSDGSNVWDASATLLLGVPVTATASTWVTTTVDRTIKAVVGVEALTQGKLVLFLQWFYFGDLTLT